MHAFEAHLNFTMASFHSWHSLVVYADYRDATLGYIIAEEITITTNGEGDRSPQQESIGKQSPEEATTTMSESLPNKQRPRQQQTCRVGPEFRQTARFPHVRATFQAVTQDNRTNRATWRPKRMKARVFGTRMNWPGNAQLERTWTSRERDLERTVYMTAHSMGVVNFFASR